MNLIPAEYEDTLRTARPAQIEIVAAHPRSDNVLYIALHDVGRPCFAAIALPRPALREMIRQMTQMLGATR